ncbi:ATP-binding protein [Streptomyces albipurpureus]|uniref:ATP-binding protein n=1 Tax=Streptomyces albipurpureus TaxID=2897419 RepID=A0ABT0UQK9_9ACTN|nr:ATP-binding protein [Streptomyces sp. CWNU-1]MCM2390647.1 ATP-binding protein [Streptomyces sp. CWNU-1]
MGTDVRGQGQTRRLALFGTRGVVSRCRDFTSRALADWGWTPAVGEAAQRADDVLLIVSELVTNACLHADGPTELVLRHTSGCVRIEVADRSPKPPRPRPREVSLPGGHGLIVLERLTHRWGSTPAGDGKVVWAEIAAAPHITGDLSGPRGTG